MKNTMEPTTVSAVQQLLARGDKLVACIDAGLVQDWVKTSRLLVLVEHSGEHGLLVCSTLKPNVTSSSDLSVENALPINDDFKCEIDSSGIDLLAGVDVYVKVTYQKQKMLFELPFSPKTNSFIQEVSKASEAYAFRTQPASLFTWLQWYKISADSEGNIRNLEALLLGDHTPNSTIKKDEQIESDPGEKVALLSFQEPSSERLNSADALSPNNSRSGELDSPDSFGNIPRHSIAMGATPLAARESVIRLQMAMREDDYTYIQNFRIFIGTWNVNGQAPSISVADWLACEPDPPDVYAVGFQELDLSKEAFLFNDTPREEEWLRAVTNGLHPGAKYRKVKLVRLIGMMLIVFIQEKHMDYVQNVCAETVGTGIMGKLGNKGGVAIRLDLHNTSICFTNCHLAAHVDEYERRNQDYNDICSRMVFDSFKPPKLIKDHDQVYWFGDLNYRIMDLDTDRVKALLEKQAYAVLLEHDQFKFQHNMKKVFVGYTEGPINFLPTYKYNPGTSEWDSSEKNRPPAWCDRILWKGLPIKQLNYQSHPSLSISDHKPVSSLFEAGVKVIDVTKYRKIYEEVMKKLDKLENEFLPQVTVDKMEIHFNKVSFIDLQSHIVTIANTGQVPVQFEFIKKLNDSSYCKDWLNIKPYTSFIMPGEKSDVEVEVYVDKRTAFKLTYGQDKLYDILVLHLDGGKDLFITVNGQYQPSCFGCSIETLIRIPDPIRSVPAERLIELGTIECLKKTEPVMEIPKELWLLVDHIFRYGMDKDELFQQPGLHSEIQHIREKLDTGWPESIPGSIHSVAEALLLFLEALAEPVIPYRFFQHCLDCSSNFILCKQMISQIPDSHRHVFYYLMSFLRELLKHSSLNKLDAKILATVFGGILLRAPSVAPSGKRENQQAIERKKSTFVYHFLMNDYDTR